MSTFEIPLTDPDISAEELDLVEDVLRSTRISSGERVEVFEAAFAAYHGRRYAVAVASPTLALMLCLRAYDLKAGDEVLLSPYSWWQIGHALAWSGIQAVFADIDYYSGTISPKRAETLITEKTRAIFAGNTKGHPAFWQELRTLAIENDLILLEDSTEAIGSRYQDKLVGSFGDSAIFAFAQPSALVCGEGAMIVTDHTEIVSRLRQYRARGISERSSVVAPTRPPLQAEMSNIEAAIGLVQLARLDGILQRRQQVEALYFEYMKSFEGIKDPYHGPDATAVHWFVYEVHLGTRFSRSSRDAIVTDLRAQGIEAASYCLPMHTQSYYRERGGGHCPTAVRVSDRTLILPFHPRLGEEEIAFIIETLKDASVNVGAGAAIY
ncbi:MAG: DegT/DnrJ/EryC1/StrS family aminotransferase [Acidithiobacillus sp.]